MSYVIAYNRKWCSSLPKILEKKTGKNFFAVDNANNLDYKNLINIKPQYIFFPHWSNIIPEEIFKNFNCIIFHMTDLPYGRGGSPLQNLIVKGHNDTMISAIKCVNEIDAGPVYLKKPLSLYGSAEEIFVRANQVIEKMIIEILQTNPQPVVQKGKVTRFKRRNPEDGDISGTQSISEIYDYIRMLDAEGYPPAFLRFGNYKLEFSRASQKFDSIIASVRITREKENE